MNNILDKHNQIDTRTENHVLHISKNESTIKKYTKKTPEPDASSVEFLETFKEKNSINLLKNS